MQKSGLAFGGGVSGDEEFAIYLAIRLSRFETSPQRLADVEAIICRMLRLRPRAAAEALEYVKIRRRDVARPGKWLSKSAP